LLLLQKLDLVADILFTYIATPDPVTGGKSECSVRLTTELQPVMKLLMKYNYTEAVKRLLVKIIDAPRGERQLRQSCMCTCDLFVEQTVGSGLQTAWKLLMVLHAWLVAAGIAQEAPHFVHTSKHA
jgi:hypothetical protein